MNSLPDIRYSLIIPAYNGEERIRRVFDRIGDFKGELIVVCDGDDRTPEVVDQISASRPGLNIRCLRFPHRMAELPGFCGSGSDRP